MRSITGVAGALLALALVGCTSGYGPSWKLTVDNRQESNLSYETRACTGELSAKLRVGQAVELDASAAPGQWSWADVTYVKALTPGAAAWVEAVCTDTGGVEVGFVRVEGRLRAPTYEGQAGDTTVLPPLTRGAAACLPATESRGLAPCVLERLIAVD